MKKIYKYELANRENEIDLPVGSDILCVKVVVGKAVIYAMVDECETVRDRIKLMIVATGQSFDPSGYKYIGTFLIDDGFLVFHVWVTLLIADVSLKGESRNG